MARPWFRILQSLSAAGALLAALLPLGTTGAARADATDPNWSTYHHDAQRTGIDPTQGTVASVSQGWTSPALDGAVYAEPLVVNGRVLVATEGNTVYSLSAGDGSVAWSRNLGAPVNTSGFPCGDVNPLGITSTPVVDTATGVLYAVAFLAPSHHQLFALNLADGSVLWSRAVDAPGADPVVHNQRGALALLAGRVYVPYGGRAGDCGSYVGRVVASAEDGSGSLLTYTVPTAREGGIWGPAGPTVDPAGSLLVSTGNSASTSTFDYGESVIRLSPTLAVMDSFTPSNWVALNQGDVDIGSVAPTLLSDSRVFQVGKAGVGYLLAGDHLGGIGGQIFSAQVCRNTSDAAFGGTSYQAPFIYVPCSDGLAAVRVSADGNSFSVAWRGPAGFAGPPIISGGLVWSQYRSGVLYALGAADGNVAYQKTLSGTAHFATPASGSGRIFVAASGGIASFAMSAVPPVAPLNQPAVGMAASPSGQGYWIVARDGGIFNYGDAGFHGSAGGHPLNQPVVGMAATPDGQGYWLVAADGGIFSYGDAAFYGSAGGHPLNKPVVGMAATPDGHGYWLVASDGGIFNYGDAGFHGSAGGHPLNQPVVGMAGAPNGQGYWLAASDGGIFNYGSAGFFGSAGGHPLNQPVVGMAAAPDSAGYWLVASDGGIFNYGSAGFHGSAAGG